MRNKIIQIAANEVGYKEQGTNQTKYGEWYGMQDEWCNIFVCWCAAQVGISEDIIPKMAYVPSTASWYDSRDQYKNSKANGGNYIPQAGDIVLFDYNHNTTSDHIGFVERVEGNTLYTIEGNKNNMVQRCTYSLDSKDIRAYCVPAYVETEVETKGKGKVYQNGTTPESVYADINCTVKVGELNPYEKCECLGIFENRAIVRYAVDRKNENEPINYKIGFCVWLDGVI